jgi:hypothetical protein
VSYLVGYFGVSQYIIVVLAARYSLSQTKCVYSSTQTEYSGVPGQIKRKAVNRTRPLY